VAGAIAVGGVLMFAAIHRLEASRGAA
jgi:hypothetical protein